ncbi:CBS domain-containing protein [Lichenihabitans sp. Uapishka_5]|uniref:CBS domain-containing protein n=1 Tax=Lichenihabitans sp. Uapishka_5 TaxID=3037302 RepID=UPI0029E821B4|nr:CBS domain-containing protein [Lichenihabitans sp. Uapishka_5]MDX7950901.1 CBS domain-containing protein [Lichenihabitans sp. Uapishka_5]
MTLSVILAAKGRDVTTTMPDRTLRDTVRTLGRERIGAIVVVDGERRVHGIVSERDIIRAVAARDLTVLDDPVSGHMTTRVETATPDSGVIEALARMTAGRFRHLPVVEDGRLAGLVSIGDLVKYRLSEMETENQAMRDYITAVA